MMLLSSASTLSIYFGYATMFMWISSVRSQCNSGSTLRALCQDATQQNSFLENDTSPTTQSIIIMCNSQNAGALTGWSQSPGGSVTTMLLDTSPSKYMVSGNTLTITNIDRTDEGLYRCIYDQGETWELCIYVYGRTVFASCPLDFDGCTGDPLSLSVMDGGNIYFNATVIHTPGGSCGFRQRITNIQLIKRNPEFGVEDKVLLFCQTASMAACSNSRVSLNRGNDPGFEFVFTLSRANVSDAGTYEVIIQGEHPSTSSLTTINKRFSIEVNKCSERSICPDGSRCINTIGSYTCTCGTGQFLFSIDNTNTCNDVNECAFGMHTCDDSTRADCIDTLGSYECVCKSGYIGNGESCIPFDDDTCSDICDQHCIKSPPRCACDRGYYLASDSHSCIDIDECRSRDLNTCVNAECNNTIGSFMCICNPGFMSDGNNGCMDINECDALPYPCDENAVCINTVGSFICNCDSSFFGDGLTCSLGFMPTIAKSSTQVLYQAVKPNHNLQYDIGTNFCIEDPVNTSFHFTINCSLTQESLPPPNFQWNVTLNGIDLDYEEMTTIGFSSYIIENDTFTLNGTVDVGFDQMLMLDIICEVSNIYGKDTKKTSISLCSPTQCQDGITNNCTQQCTRHNITGVHKCSCRDGFNFSSGSESVCEDIDECDKGTHNCSSKSRQICNNTEGSYECICESGFNLVAEDCQDVNECAFDGDSICPSSSMCVNTIGSYVCNCINGTKMDESGTNCTDINECEEGTHNCSNFASCVNIPGEYDCECRIGFEGDGMTCTDINECASDRDGICPSSFMCENIIGSYTCNCTNGTKKDENGNCTDINECEEGTHNCSNFASCVNIPRSYDCECHIGFEGDGMTCKVSDGFIIGISIVGVIMVMVGFLNMVTAGGIKFRKWYRSTTKKFRFTKKPKDQELDMVHNHHETEDNEYKEVGFTGNAQRVVIKGSLREKLPPSLSIKSTSLRVLDPIGQGEFGIVYKGYLSGQYMDEVVAIKTLKGFIENEAVQELLNECIKMKSLNHLHVMTLKGLCLDGGPVPYIVMPYMANGSLLSYLKKERPNLIVCAEGDVNSEEEKQSQVLIIKKRLLDMCLQVAKGMDYLASEKIVHRDLAARNCMIDMNMVIKVADFGLSVNVGAKEYYRLRGDMGTKLLIMWMAPESLSDYIFSEKSDIWSYGVTCWEIFTGGLVPYIGTKPSSLLTLLQQGGRLEIPNNSACSTEMYSIMMWCWEMEPGKRPSFSNLVKTLSKSLEKTAGYLPIGAFAGLKEENAHYIHVGDITERNQEALVGQAEQEV